MGAKNGEIFKIRNGGSNYSENGGRRKQVVNDGNGGSPVNRTSLHTCFNISQYVHRVQQHFYRWRENRPRLICAQQREQNGIIINEVFALPYK